MTGGRPETFTFFPRPTIFFARGGLAAEAPAFCPDSFSFPPAFAMIGRAIPTGASAFGIVEAAAEAIRENRESRAGAIEK